MFRRKVQKRMVVLSPAELQLARNAMLYFRNKLLAEGKPMEDLNRLLKQMMK